MKTFSDPRELLGQISIDLEAKSGRVGNIFRTAIRKELEKLGNKDTISVSIKQISNGSMISLKIEEWVDKLERTRIEEEFKDLMDRIGATTTGICSGSIPSNLVSFLNQGS